MKTYKGKISYLAPILFIPAIFTFLALFDGEVTGDPIFYILTWLIFLIPVLIPLGYKLEIQNNLISESFFGITLKKFQIESIESVIYGGVSLFELVNPVFGVPHGKGIIVLANINGVRKTYGFSEKLYGKESIEYIRSPLDDSLKDPIRVSKQMNFSTVSGTLFLVWFLFSPIIGLVLYSHLSGYFNILVAYILVPYVIFGFIFYWLGKYLNNILKTKGYSKKEIVTSKHQTVVNNKYQFWSLKINSVEHANIIINDTAWLFWVFGVIYFLLSLFVTALGFSWMDGLLLVFFGSMLAIKRNTWTSVVVLILGISTVIATFYNKIMNNGKGGTNMYLAIIFLWTAIQSFLAVQYIKKYDSDSTNPEEKIKQKRKKLFFISAWASFVVCIVFVLLIIASYYK